MPHRLIPTGKRCCGYGNETEYGYFFLPVYTGDYPQVSGRREVGLLDEGSGACLWVITSVIRLRSWRCC